MNKQYITHEDIKNGCENIANRIISTEKKFDTIIAVTRGGLIPAGYLSYFLDIKKIATLSVSSYDDDHTQDESVFELQEAQLRKDIKRIILQNNSKNILIVDDLIDTGNTLKFIDVNMQAVLNGFIDRGHEDLAYEWNFGVVYKTDVISTLNKKVYFGEHKPDGWLVFPWDVFNSSES